MREAWGTVALGVEELPGKAEFIASSVVGNT